MAQFNLNLYAERGIDTWGHHHVSPVLISGGADTYATGGMAIAGGDVKLGRIEEMLGGLAIATTGAATAILLAYNRATGKLQAFWQTNIATSALIEVANGTDLSDYTALVLFLGTP